MRLIRFLPVVLALLVLPLFVFAQTTIPDPSDTDAIFKAISDALVTGNWRVALTLGTIALVFFLRKGGTKLPAPFGPFFASSRGGAVLALVGGLVVAFAPVAMGTATLNLKLIIEGLLLAFSAAGGWVVIRRLFGMDAATVVNPEAAKTLTPATAPTSDVASGLDPK